MDESLSLKFRENLSLLRSQYNSFIKDFPAQIEQGFFEPGAHLTNGEIYNTVMYGEMSHTSDPKKRTRYQFWARDDIRSSVLTQVFSQIILRILFMIYELSDLCEKELENSSGNGST
jgi:hypothetical protein